MVAGAEAVVPRAVEGELAVARLLAGLVAGPWRVVMMREEASVLEGNAEEQGVATVAMKIEIFAVVT